MPDNRLLPAIPQRRPRLSSRAGLTLPAGPSRQTGFTLMELLVVLAVLLIITVIAIPNLTGMNLQANENSAIAGLRSIYDSEVRYQAAFPTRGFACSLDALGGHPGVASPSPRRAQVLPDDLASGHKSGYIFTITACTKDTQKDHDQYTSFAVSATPRVLGKTGHRGFCIDQQGEVKADPTGGSNCSLSLQ